MPTEKEIKLFVENYKNDEGENPIVAALNIWTFAKSIPLQILKSGVLSILIYGITVGVAWYLDVPWWMFLVMVIGGGLALFFLIFTGLIRFVSHSFIDAISDLFSSLISPIDDMYDLYQDSNEEKLSRTQFAGKVINDVLLPRVSDSLSLFPMKGSLGKSLGVFSNVLEEKKKEIEIEEKEFSVEDVKNSSVKSLMANVYTSSSKAKSIMSKPFFFVALFYLVVWGGLIILHLIF